VLIEYSSGDSRYGKGLEDTLTTTQPGKDFLERFPEAVLMTELENHASHTGVHAAGFIVANEPVTEYCTVRDGVAQIDKKDAEYLNLLKMDVLGLRTLGVIEDSGCVTAEELYNLPLTDPEVFRIFNEAKFSGVFQFEGAAQRRVSVQIPVSEFQQIDHITALARPGPLGGGAANTYINRNAGREETTYKHESMRKYLEDTRGVVLYQEQVMRIVKELGDFSWEDTSVIRKAMSGRKGKEFFDRHGEKFAAGAAQHGIDAETAKAIWNEIVNFGAWGMNKCISGTTKVRLAHANQFFGSEPTIAELYEYYKANPSSWIKQRKAMPKLLSWNGSAALPVEAVDIFETGVKPCVLLKFSDGYPLNYFY
jgi:DNA polymerase III alpha subunit